MGLKINMEYAMKGLISAILLMVAPIIGVILRNSSLTGFAIAAIVIVLNILAVIGLSFYLKADFIKKEDLEEQPESEKSKSKSK